PRRRPPRPGARRRIARRDVPPRHRLSRLRLSVFMTTLTAPPPTGGGTELLSYRAYRGTFRGPLGGAWAIARTGLWTILRRKLFWGLYTFALLIFLFFFFGQYLMSWVSTQLGEGPIFLNQSTRIRIE